MNIPLSEIATRLNDHCWRIIEIVQRQPNISKKELYEQIGGISFNKFNLEYTKVHSLCLVDESKDQEDGRHLKIKLTSYGEEILKLKAKIS